MVQSGRLTPSKSSKKTPRPASRTANDQPEAGPLPLWATAVAIFFSVLVAYWPALNGGMVWDDDVHITPAGMRSLHGLWRTWFDLGATPQYYPLLHTAFWMEHHLWGDAVLGYHLTNLTQHAISAFLLVLILRQLKLSGAWLAGFVFALHPVCVEAVAWISEQKSTLSGVLYLAAALTYLHFDRSRRKPLYVLALGLFLLALLCKTVTATLPAALLVVFWWRRGRIDWRRDAVPLLPWFAIGASAGIFTAWVERTYIGATGKTYELTLAQHILLAGRIPWFYAGKILWPVDFMFSYPHWQLDPSAWWQYLYPAGVVAALALALVVTLRSNDASHRAPLASLLFFGGTLVPVLGFLHVFPFKFSYVADHFQYLACLGIIVPVACWLVTSVPRVTSYKSAGNLVGTLVLLVLGVLTWRQSSLYRDAETLYRATLERNPGSWMTHNNLGGVLMQVPGRLPEAVDEYEAAIRLKPDYAIAYNSLGGALMQMPGRSEEAIAQYRAAIKVQPDFVLAHNNLGIALVLMPGGLNDAIAEFQTAIRIQPTYAKAHMNLGNAYSQMPGRLGDAISEYRAAVQLQPDFAPAYVNLGSVLMQTPGRLPEAIDAFQEALRLQPNNAKAHQSLGFVLAQSPGKLPEAIAEYQAALSLQPNDPDLHMGLGDALAQFPERQQEAIAQYLAALEARPDSEAARQAIERLQGKGSATHPSKP